MLGYRSPLGIFTGFPRISSVSDLLGGGCGEKIHTYLQTLQQQQSVSREELQVDKSEIIKEYDRLVDGPAARQWLEKERPSLVAARDQAIVELRREKLQKETAEKPHKVARVRR
jgi:hypothetical protein